MQTKTQIQHLLSQAGVRPRKSLGQHFLIDLNLMRLLVETARLTKNDVVLEVGPATGSLTTALAQSAGRVIAVELDPNLVTIAAAQLKEFPNAQLFNTDILESKHRINKDIIAALSSASAEFCGRLLLVSNLPYDVACPLIVNLVTADPVADAMFVTVQKEVADRLTAAPGTKDYGPLSVLLSATGRVEIIRTLKPSVFWPPPKVDSAMVAFTRQPDKVAKIADMRTLTAVVNLFMQHRRKMLKAAAKFAPAHLQKITDWPALLASASIDPASRPDKLPPHAFVTFANLCSKSLNIKQPK